VDSCTREEDDIGVIVEWLVGTWLARTPLEGSFNRDAVVDAWS